MTRHNISNERSARLAIAIATGLVAYGAASGAQFSFPAFNPSPSAVGNTWRNQDLLSLVGGSMPAGNWVGYNVEVDWSNSIGGVNSADLRTVFSATGVASTTQNFPFSGGGTKYTNSIPRMPDNGSADSFDVSSVRFRGGFTTNYAGGANPLNLAYRHQFTSGTPDWANVRVTLFDNYDEMLDVTDLGVLTPGTTTITDSYTRRDTVRWYKFSVGGDMGLGDYLSIDTLGNSLVGGGQGDSDTQIFIFNPVTGSMVYQNNDFLLDGDLRRESLFISGDQSSSPFPTASSFAQDGGLFAGAPLYLAVAPSGITEQFGQKFTLNGAIDLATPGVDLTGSYTIHFNTNVAPAPGGVGLLGFGGLLALRRRR